jgi:hypothetical protein
MRIAVLVYGRLNECANNYENYIESIGREHEVDFFMSSDNPPEEYLNQFLSLYKPISYDNSKVQYEYDLKSYNKRGETNLHNMSCHFTNKNRVLLLLETYLVTHPVQYDVVLSLRVDVVIQNHFNFNNLVENNIYIPAGFDWVENGLNDQIAYGHLDVMKKYNGMNVLDLVQRKLSIVHPESLVFANVRFHGLKVNRVNLNYKIVKNKKV